MPQANTARISLPDRYRMVRHLANGGMASVWEAHDQLLGRDVAVKVLAGHLSEDERARLRFEREGRAAAGLSSHPNVVTIYDVAEHDGRALMVMELMRGGSLADRLRTGEPIPRERALDWLHEAAAALDVAHEAGIVHRDIKPANLLLDERERLAIADFGIARVAETDQLTQTGQVLGTASYLSPEQALGEPAVAASDRYALAVVAYELLTGSRPFTAEHFAAQARAHVEDVPERPSARNPSLPASVDAVLSRGLAKEPADRWPSSRDMVERLEDALREAPARAAVVPDPEPTRAMPRTTAGRPIGPPPRRRGSGVLLGLLAGALALAIVAVVLLSGGGDDPAPARQASTAEATATATETPEKTPEKTATATATPTATPTATATEEPTGQPDLAQARLLQQQGHQANQAGDHPRALELSMQAHDACGGTRTVDPCGYAAYDIGYALNRMGRSDEAVPFLEERLAYGDNGNGDVKRELKLAKKGSKG